MKVRLTYTDETELQTLLDTPLKEFLASGAKMKTDEKTGAFRHAYIAIHSPKRGA